MNEPLQPVWIVFPNIPWGSIGWRMGGGEAYWHKWTTWFRSLPEPARQVYKSKWLEPDRWIGFYSFIETGKLPEWFQDMRRKVTEAAIPPTPDEHIIEDYYRVLWLIRQHLKRICVEHPLPGESIAELYLGPDGVQWRLSSDAIRGGMRLVRQAQ
jgi:hypothetical protein